jgi:hypothetical protein
MRAALTQPPLLADAAAAAEDEPVSADATS